MICGGRYGVSEKVGVEFVVRSCEQKLAGYAAGIFCSCTDDAYGDWGPTSLHSKAVCTDLAPIP